MHRNPSIPSLNENTSTPRNHAGHDEPSGSSSRADSAIMETGDNLDTGMSAIYKYQFPVTCGDHEGILVRERLKNGKPCIRYKDKWLTPAKFEEVGGKKNCRRWKTSIRFQNVPLEKLIKDGRLQCGAFKRKQKVKHLQCGAFKRKQKVKHLQCGAFKRKRKMNNGMQMKLTLADTRTHIEVKCGTLSGKLHKGRFASGSCGLSIHTEEHSMTEFVKVGGKKSCNREKTSTRFQNEPLEKRIKDGRLQLGAFKRKQKVKHLQYGAYKRKQNKTKTHFKVKCGALSGKLHKERFASGGCGLSIRTEECWMTPDEFVKAASHVENPEWSKDIQWEGRPLSVLVERATLRVHPTDCLCFRCKPSHQDLENQKNDDKCCVCKSDTSQHLVACDQCPLAFHQECHLPQVNDSTLRDDNKWLCTFCIFKQAQDWHYSNETRKSRKEMAGKRVSDYMMQCQYLFLYLYSSDEDQVLPEDKTMNQLGMKLQNNQINTLKDFAAEVKSLFKVCLTVNQGNKKHLETCVKLQGKFKKKFDEVFNILQKNDA